MEVHEFGDRLEAEEKARSEYNRGDMLYGITKAVATIGAVAVLASSVLKTSIKIDAIRQDALKTPAGIRITEAENQFNRIKSIYYAMSLPNYGTNYTPEVLAKLELAVEANKGVESCLEDALKVAHEQVVAIRENPEVVAENRTTKNANMAAYKQAGIEGLIGLGLFGAAGLLSIGQTLYGRRKHKEIAKIQAGFRENL